MHTRKFISIKNLITVFGLMLSANIYAQLDAQKTFNDTLIPVHDPVIIRGDSINQARQTTSRGKREPIYIAWDEYNVWYRARSGEAASGKSALEEKYNLEDALVVAEFLNAFVRNADVVKMANLAQLVNVIATIFTNETGMFKQTIFFPLQLFSNNVYGTSLEVFLDSKTYNTSKFLLGPGETSTLQKNIPYLDVSATYQNGELVVNVVNRNKDEAITRDIISQNGAFPGDFVLSEINLLIPFRHIHLQCSKEKFKNS